VKIFLRAVLLLALVAALVLAVNYLAIPTHNRDLSHFDTIIVLGYPSNADGTPSPEQRERVLEGVREYKAGVAPRLILSGAAAHNTYIESHVMALLAIAQGVPAADILEEPQALNTIQNIYYSAQIMHQHHWSSAEVVSSPSHLPRTSLILRAFDRVQPTLAIDWRTQKSQWPAEYSPAQKIELYGGEAAYCLRLRMQGFPRSRFLPGS
jgi:uncharacterized SAM-binding protein YcdF (DUF218 family)